MNNENQFIWLQCHHKIILVNLNISFNYYRTNIKMSDILLLSNKLEKLDLNIQVNNDYNNIYPTLKEISYEYISYDIIQLTKIFPNIHILRTNKIRDLKILQEISNWKYLTQIQIVSGNDIISNNIKSFGISCQFIKYLQIFCSNDTNNELEETFKNDYLLYFPSLESLSLLDHSFYDQDVDYLINSSKIIDLSIAHLQLSLTGIQKLVKMYPNLTNVYFTNDDFDFDDDMTVVLVTNCIQLQKLEIAGSYTDISMIAIGKYLINLQHLIIYAPRVTDEGILNLFQYCIHLNYCKLISLELLTGQSLQYIAKYHKNELEIDIDNYLYITTQDVIDFCEIMKDKSIIFSISEGSIIEEDLILLRNAYSNKYLLKFCC